MVKKIPICPQRLRRIPKQFNWVDHRLVRDHYIDRCSHQAAALYLFLVTVGDAQGLSFYSDPSIMERLSMDEGSLDRAREDLVRNGLIAYKKPLYQVLALENPQSSSPSNARISTGPQSIAQIFKQISEGIS